MNNNNVFLRSAKRKQKILKDKPYGLFITSRGTVVCELAQDHRTNDYLILGTYGYVHSCYRAATILKSLPDDRESIVFAILQERAKLSLTPFEKEFL